MENKICKICGRELPLSEFYKRKGAKDGYRNECKVCHNQCTKQYYKEHKEEHSEYCKQYRAEHKEYLYECHKQYSQNHKEELSEYHKQYYEEHKEERTEKIKQCYKKYYSSLRGYCVCVRNSNISNDRKKGIVGDKLPDNYPTIENYMELLQQPDFYDGKQYHWSEMGLDRINNDMPHTLDNVIPCTTEHNVNRKNMPFEEFKLKFKR